MNSEVLHFKRTNENLSKINYFLIIRKFNLNFKIY